MELRKKGQHYSKQFIAETLSELESGMSRGEVLGKRGLSRNTLREWISRYGNEEVQKGVRPYFTEQQRRNIIRKIILGEMTTQEASLAHGVAKKTLKIWLRDNGKVDNADIDTNQSVMPNLNNSTDKELQKAHLKILALETMIDEAEHEFKIKIRKKSGAKQ